MPLLNVPKQSRVNFIGFACGVKGSGKSTLVNKWASRFPRRIVLDFVAEMAEELPGAIECLNLTETVEAMADMVHENKRQFTIIACIRPEEVPQLCNMLAPLDNPRGGYSIGSGGILLDCSECELVWPNDGSMSPEASNLIHRGRHYLVSVAAATRRTKDVSRLLTSQSDAVACFRQQEQRDLKYIADNLGTHVSECVAALPEHAYVLKMPATGLTQVIQADGTKRMLENPATLLPSKSRRVPVVVEKDWENSGDLDDDII